jgi:hypothetical protein
MAVQDERGPPEEIFKRTIIAWVAIRNSAMRCLKGAIRLVLPGVSAY